MNRPIYRRSPLRERQIQVHVHRHGSHLPWNGWILNSNLLFYVNLCSPSVVCPFLCLANKIFTNFYVSILCERSSQIGFWLDSRLSEDILICFYNYFYRQISSPKRNIQRNLRGYGHYFRRNGWILREPKRSNQSRPSSVSFISLSKLNPKVQSYNPPSYQPYNIKPN